VSHRTVFLPVVGLAIAAATWLRGEERPSGQRLLHALFATILWPLALPLLFTPRAVAPAAPPIPAPSDVAGRIAQVEERLAQALAKLPGLAGAALAPELARVRGVTTALLRLERRLGEMRAALAGPELDVVEARAGFQSCTRAASTPRIPARRRSACGSRRRRACRPSRPRPRRTASACSASSRRSPRA
jgi:hypothetical protein